MNGITAAEVVSIPKALPEASKGATSQSEAKTPNAVVRALGAAAAAANSLVQLKQFLALGGDQSRVLLKHRSEVVPEG